MPQRQEQSAATTAASIASIAVPALGGGWRRAVVARHWNRKTYPGSDSPLILLIDNYDSFVFNLARYFCRLGQETHVVRNDAITPAQVSALAPSAIVISPGPRAPNEAGCSLEVVKEFAGTIPLLGVCLGHQAIAQAFGGNIVRAVEPMHGRASPVFHDGSPLFAGLENPFTAGRYHSLVAEKSSLPAALKVTAHTQDGAIMGLQHRDWAVYGVQFHPESVLTRQGYRLLKNFLEIAGLTVPSLPSMSNELLLPPERPILRPATPVSY